MDIKMVDTVGQYHKIQAEIDQALKDILEKGTYIGGPIVKNFEANLAKYVGAKYAIACANGTDALQIALMALGLQPGDEVITPTFTYMATVEVIALLKLRPVFVEVNPRTFNIDTWDIERKITPKTKAIVPVHLYGQSADMEKIMEISRKYNIPVVEDNAQAIGAEYFFSEGGVAKTGSMGTIACTSFYPSKNLGAYGDGGAIFTNDDKLAEYIRMICNHGQKVKYQHETIGVNSRLDTLQAAILDIKLKHLDEYNAARQWVASRYDRLLEDADEIILPFCSENCTHVYHQYTIRIVRGRAKRDAIKAYLEARKVPSMIYYPIPSHLQKGYAGYGYKEGDFPLSEQLTEEVISLPIHTEMNEEQIRYIVKHFREALEKA